MQAPPFLLVLHALGGTFWAGSALPMLAQTAAARQSCGFGSVQAGGSPVAHTFRITNTDKTAITWQRLTTTCHCTSAQAANSHGVPAALPITLQPGQTLSVLVSLDTRGLAPGPTTKYVYLFERGQSVPACTLEMTGIVRAVPASQDIGRGPEKSKHFMRTNIL